MSIMSFFKPSTSSYASLNNYEKISFESDIESIQSSASSPLWSRTKRFLKRLIILFFLVIFSLLTLTALFNPSYTNGPSFKIQEDEKIFITANIINEELILGPWGDSIIGLIDLLGSENVFLSIYGGPTSALRQLEERIQCNSSIVSEEEDPINFESLYHIELPNHEKKLKRTEYLAEVRNRALRPIHNDKLSLPTFDKILFLNDVIFDPRDAARLLFSTNANDDGKTDYRAACAVDFVNAFKFYDTFATRDSEGNSMGLPFFPFFANIGNAQSRREVMEGKEAVRVKSCWGGMIAFEAKWFQETGDDSRYKRDYSNIDKDDREDHNHDSKPDSSDNNANNKTTTNSHIQFRAEKEPFWDASECCLINADLEELSPGGIYMNPYVRVAYDSRTFKWLSFTRRFERLYSLIHDILNRLVSLPHKNIRYQEQAGDTIIEEHYSHGQYKTIHRTAGVGGYCGSKMLQVMKANPKEGEKMWESVKLNDL